jgi:DNA-binding response OmpR family regulator
VVTPSARPLRVLVVEDDPALAASIRRHLERGGSIVDVATSEREAVRRATDAFPDVVLLDLTLAEGSGEGVCRQIRASDRIGDVPILVLSAKGALASKAELFSLGADDYLVKPFDPAELLLRVDALLRRRTSTRDVRRVGPLAVTLATGDAWLRGRALQLTAGERKILSELARAWPGLAPREVLARAPWRDDLTTSENVVEVLVGRLRRKIDAAGGGVLIRSVRRSGYFIEVTEAARSAGGEQESGT